MIFCYAQGYFVGFFCLFIYFSSMLSIAFSDSLVLKLTLILYLTDWLVLDDKVCESSTSSNCINLSSSFNNSVCIEFLWYSEVIMLLIII